MCPNHLNDNWAVLTVKYRPYFEKSAVARSTGLVDPKHCSGNNTPGNREAWISFVQKEVFGEEYKAFMTAGWNEGLKELMNTDGADANEKGGDNRGVDFSFGKKTPWTQGDVKDILFGEEVTKMVKSGSLEDLRKPPMVISSPFCQLSYTFPVLQCSFMFLRMLLMVSSTHTLPSVLFFLIDSSS